MANQKEGIRYWNSTYSASYFFSLIPYTEFTYNNADHALSQVSLYFPPQLWFSTLISLCTSSPQPQIWYMTFHKLKRSWSDTLMWPRWCTSIMLIATARKVPFTQCGRRCGQKPQNRPPCQQAGPPICRFLPDLQPNQPSNLWTSAFPIPKAALCSSCFLLSQSLPQPKTTSFHTNSGTRRVASAWDLDSQICKWKLWYFIGSQRYVPEEQSWEPVHHVHTP